METNNIVVLGFGRSGTTWIADIISKILGQLILFEPLHPSVTDLAARVSYSSLNSNGSSELLRSFYDKVLNKKLRKKWLMRNHVPDRLERVSDGFLDTLWEECSIAGFKEIRANFMMEWFMKELDAKIVFIMRHPGATISSIKGRPNFWEFGWPGTYNLFLQRTIYHKHYREHQIANHIDLVKSAATYAEKCAVMWAITHAIALPELERLGLPIFFYEEFYDYPFASTRALMHYLGQGDASIHPSYLFTPSMTTLMTIHGIRILEEERARKGIAFFEEKLSEKELADIMRIVQAFGIKIYDHNGLVKPQVFHKSQLCLSFDAMTV
jgi:hypothetical protein